MSNIKTKNPIIILVIVAAVAILGIGAYMLNQKSSTSDAVMQKQAPNFMAEDNDSAKPAETMMSKTQEEMTGDTISNSRYVEYLPEALDQAVLSRRVLFFYASWCPTCQPADANFKENIDKIPEDMVVIRVNYNDPSTSQAEKDLAARYGITYQHTFVQIDATGNEVTKWNGGQIDELLSNSI